MDVRDDNIRSIEVSAVCRGASNLSRFREICAVDDRRRLEEEAITCRVRAPEELVCDVEVGRNHQRSLGSSRKRRDSDETGLAAPHRQYDSNLAVSGLRGEVLLEFCVALALGEAKALVPFDLWANTLESGFGHLAILSSNRTWKPR